ncbi:MAG: alpha-amylase family glycosyl hydrolase [Candidatus Thiodiazotropha sp. LLP2]
MTISRKKQICLEETPYYHCVSRCVRRAFLCGEDELSGRSYEHRRDWVVEQLKHLTEYFSIGICAYAMMHNHNHTVVKIDQQQALAWSSEEVISRWTALYNPSPIVSRYLDGFQLTKAEMEIVSKDVEKWRHRLYDVSWFMRNLNEEDGCSGRFWEGRFKSQALLDDAALLTCMTYVDLNPIRAGLAETPETSDFTSIHERIRYYHKQLSQTKNPTEVQITAPNGLLPFTGGEHQDKQQGLCFNLTDYLELIDWAGRVIRADKSGAIPAQLAPILERLNINPEAWLETIQNYNKTFYGVVGTKKAVKAYSAALERKWFCLTGLSGKLYRSPVA